MYIKRWAVDHFTHPNSTPSHLLFWLYLCIRLMNENKHVIEDLLAKVHVSKSVDPIGSIKLYCVRSMIRQAKEMFMFWEWDIKKRERISRQVDSAVNLPEGDRYLLYRNLDFGLNLHRNVIVTRRILDQLGRCIVKQNSSFHASLSKRTKNPVQFALLFDKACMAAINLLLLFHNIYDKLKPHTEDSLTLDAAVLDLDLALADRLRQGELPDDPIECY
ncbi:hypothetical protein BDN70DRAFT_940054 [Pholiota conissans]|uniref:Uncharacterized protein n=1 Tax=Pholiota conissans TaxID=109636 RepID=A0A9P5YJ95_9AGAR|nr:hypothetical protein BDN70DRAFT_940054 [Pholiota conissans]